MPSSEMFGEKGSQNRESRRLFHMAGTAKTFLSIVVKMQLETLVIAEKGYFSP